ncbi:hypothetical protein SeMB42_g05827 [Synchytrium endobioticum]|uniref:Secreted protein n=1 Tax=Synchytrium endobioticum TaxID=286115 RepID=A0A507CP33_9FUNG|nr:hypothetical protein SeMB42_g05827 [Synchytrium endobioticum]
MRALFIIAIFLYCSSCALAGDPPEPQPSQLFKLFGPLWFRQHLKNPDDLRQLELWLRKTRVMMLEKSNELRKAINKNPRRLQTQRAHDLDCLTQTNQHLGLPFEDIPPIEPIPLDFTLENYRSMCEALRDFGDTKGRIRIFLGKYKCTQYNKWLALILPEERIELNAEQSHLLNAIDEFERGLNDRYRKLSDYLASLPKEDPRLGNSGWPYEFGANFRVFKDNKGKALCQGPWCTNSADASLSQVGLQNHLCILFSEPHPLGYEEEDLNTVLARPPWFDQINFHPSQGGGSSERDWTSQGGIYQAGTSTINQYLFGGTLGVGYDTGHASVSQPLDFMHPQYYGGDIGQTSGHGNTADGDVRHTSPGHDKGPIYRPIQK